MVEIHKQAAAEDDLVAIWRYSCERWGIAQADRYLDELGEAIEALAGNPRLGSDCGHVRACYRRLRIRHHSVYYRLSASRIEIVRVLHERMEPDRHLIQHDQL